MKWMLLAFSTLLSLQCAKGEDSIKLGELVRDSIKHGHGIFVVLVKKPIPTKSNLGTPISQIVVPTDTTILLKPKEGNQFNLKVGDDAFLSPPRMDGEQVIVISMNKGNNIIWTKELEKEIKDTVVGVQNGAN